MAAEDERNISATLDCIDYAPNAFLGFTNQELMAFASVCFVSLAIVFSIASGILFNMFLIGIPAALLPTIPITLYSARRAYMLKAKRPSYMMWIDLQEKFQFEGVLGFKIYFGFIKTTKWDTCSAKK